MRSSFYCSFVSVWAVIALAGSLGFAYAREENERVRLANASFEEGKSTPEGWRALKGNGTRPGYASVLAWDREFARTGERSLYIRKEGVGPVRWQSIDPVAVIPGEEYELTFWFRATASHKAAVRAGVTSQSKDEQGKLWESGRQVAISGPTADWQPFTMSFVPPPHVDSLIVSLINMGPERAGVACELWFDDVSLRPKAKK